MINSLLERHGARTALVATKGFRDVVEVGRGNRPLQFELGYRYYVDKPADGPRWGVRFTVTLIFAK